MTFRIGYACKYMHEDRTLSKKMLDEKEKLFNSRSTTALWCRNNPQLAQERIHDIVLHNINAIQLQLNYVSSLPSSLHMLRIGSDVLPLYTHAECSHFYNDAEFLTKIEKGLFKCGEFARTHGIRISFHPAQYTVLASENPNVVTNSIREFEYHATMLRWMGYGKTFQDAKCNVHVGGKLGYQGIIDVLGRLSPEARNVLTIENDEMTHGLDQVLNLVNHVPIVLDVHHHYINTGEYINYNDDRVKRVMDSWRGVRPTMHYSVSREMDICKDTLVDLNMLLLYGFNKQTLRAHSDRMWNNACNRWAATFLAGFDIMIEAKHKNLASIEFYHNIKDLI